MHHRLLKLSFISLLLIGKASGQTVSADSSFLAVAQNQAINSYEGALTEKTHLYTGHEFIPHDRRVKVHPYFATDSLRSGSIAYNGLVYNDVMMLYDVVRDELAIQAPKNVFRIRPHTEQIRAFSLGNHQFARIVGDSAAGVRTGFYDMLHNGRVQFLAKRVKTVHEDISGGVYKADYLVKDRYYILKDGIYHEVRNKRSVFRLFPDQSSALRKYLRSTRFNFNEQREEAITAIVKQYENLTH